MCELLYGKVVVVAKNPTTMLSSVRKQWLRMARKVDIEHAKTFDSVRLQELSWPTWVLHHTSFTAKPPGDFLVADVTFATADHLLRAAPECRTMIVTYKFKKEDLYVITAWMPRHGTVIIYA